MFLKVVCLMVCIHISLITCHKRQFVIKNKKTEMVLHATSDETEIRPWENKTSQLWTLEEIDNHFIITNVGNGEVLDASPLTKKVLTYTQHSESNQQWILQMCEATRLQVAYYPKDFLAHKHGKLVLCGCQPHDDSDRWFFVESKDMDEPEIY